MSARPPRLAEWLLTRSIPAQDRETQLGDLREEYDGRARSAGPRVADVWYWRETRRSLGPNLRRRWQDAPAFTLRGAFMGVWQDVRYAVRTLGKTPVLTTMIVLSLAIGIGANSAMFSVVDALLLSPLPYPQPDRLAAIWLHSPGIGIVRDWPSPGQFNDLRLENHSFESMSLSRLTSFALTDGDEPELVDGMRTSSSLFGLLGARAMLGRLLVPEDDGQNAPPVAVLSHGLWRRRFDSDPQIVGRAIHLSGNSVTVVGVLTPDFLLNADVMPAEGPADRMDVFLPLPVASASFLGRRGDENYNILARLKPGVSLQQAQADVDVIAGEIRQKDKRDQTYGMTVTGLLDQVVGDVRRTVLVLLGSVALVLLIACANVANLLLTRATGREREMAVRTAIGASWPRLVRQLLTESVVLALLGGIAGIVVAEVSLHAVRVINPGNIPRLADIRVNAMVLTFTCVVSVLTGMLFGFAPAWSAMTLDVNRALKSGGRSGHEGGGLRLARHRLRGLLVISELALSLMLLIGAGLLIRSFVRLSAVPPGFATDHIISMRVVVPGSQQPPAVVALFDQIGDRVRRLPGVKAAGLTSVLPLTGVVGWGGINVEGFTPQPGQELQADIRSADFGYFTAMGIPVIAGRAFSDRDTADSQPVVIIDEKFADRFWPRHDAIGRHLWFDPKKPLTIAGVVGSVKQYGLDSDSKIVVYFPAAQQPNTGLFLVAHTATDPATLTNAITAEVHAVSPAAVVDDARTMQDRLYSSFARRRFATALLGSFALFAMALAAIGVYGVVSYLVTQNTHEIGIRLALGARKAGVVGLVLRRGMSLAIAGIAAGLIGAVALTRVMASLLFGVHAIDWPTFAAVAVLLGAIALCAAAIPAWRVTRVGPSVALRQD